MEDNGLKTVDEILDGLRGDMQGNTQSVMDIQPIFGVKDRNTFTDIKRDVPVDAIYTRLSDGSYSSKYDSYQGAYGNEERLAADQGFFEKAGRGLAKFGIKSGIYATQSLAFVTTGVASAINRGEWSALWDNDAANWLDDYEKRTENQFAHYYSQEEKNMGVLRSALTTNFWFNDVAGGLAFVAGAILPEAAIGVLSGGTSLGVSAAKFAAVRGGKSVLKEAAKAEGKAATRSAFNKGVRAAADKIPLSAQYKQGVKTIRDINTGIFRNKALGDIASTASFLGRASGYEAGMEARHNFKDAMDTYVNTYEELNGKKPGYEELTAFAEDSKDAANGVFWTNMAILSVSNSVMFADKFKVATNFRKGMNRNFESLIGLGVKREGTKLVAQQATRGQKIVGNAYKILAKPLTEGLYEEGLQGVAGNTMQNYLEAKYNPNIDELASVMQASHQAFADQYGTKEGWKEMFIGMIIGSGAGLIQGGGIVGAGKDSWSARSKQIAEGVKTANASLENLTSNMNRAGAMSALANQIASGKDASPIVSAESTLINKDFIATQETFKDQTQIAEDYNTVVDMMELDAEQIKEIGGEQNLEAYKTQLKETFSRDLANYNAATKLADALGIQDIKNPADKSKKMTKGNTLELRDLVITNLMIGYAAEQGAIDIGETLGAILGDGGIYSALNTIANMSAKKAEAIEKIKAKQARLSTLRDISEKYLRQMETSSTAETTKKYQRASQLYTKALAEETQLEEEIARLTQSMSSAETLMSGGQFQLEGLENVLVDQGILDAMEKVDKIEEYTKALRNEGRTKEANDIEYLIQEYKNQVDAARETKMFYADLMDGKSLQGKRSLPAILLGRTYKVDDETKALIEENDLKVNRALGAVGIKGPETALEKYNSLVGENGDLSDRQKFKIDSYVRMSLAQDSYINKKDRQQESESPVETVGKYSFEGGDTITVEGNPEYSDRDLSDVNVLNEIIADMEEAIKQYRKSGSELRNPLKGSTEQQQQQNDNSAKIAELEKQLSELRDRAEKVAAKTATRESRQREINDLKLQLADFYKESENRETKKTKEIEKIEELENKINQLQEEHERKVEEYRPQEIEPKEEVSTEEINQRSREVAEENKKVDALVESRADKGVPTVDFMQDFTEAMEKQLDRVEAGIPTSVTVVRELSDYFYRKYKELSDMRRNPQARVELGLTEEDVLDLMTEYSMILDHLKAAEDAIATQSEMPVFTPQSIESIQEEVRQARRSLAEQQIQERETRDDLLNKIVALEAQEVNEETTTETEESTVPGQIEQIEKEIEELRNQPTPETQEVDTGINRLTELESKAAKDELTEEEAQELEELGNEIDDWIVASGAVYRGHRLSDLIRQRETILNTPIEDIERVNMVTDEDFNASVAIPDRQNKGNYSMTLHYDAAMATRVKDGDGKGTPMMEISNITPERLMEEVGFEFDFLTNTQGNILITEEVAERINSESNVRIEMRKDSTGSNYTTIKVERTNLKEEVVMDPLKTDFNEETTKPQDTNALYNMKTGETVQIEIDPMDSYNQGLIEQYKKDKDKKKLKNSLLIRVLDAKGNFAAILKGKERSTKSFTGNKEFAAFRDNIIENEEYLEMIIDSTLPFRVDGHNIKVDKVLIGHPNTAVEYRPLTVDDSVITDVGYVENGKVWTKAEEGNVDTTFLNATMNGAEKGAKIPFMVFNQGNKRIAYPIRFNQADNAAVTQLTEIFNSDALEVDKAVAMNKLLAERGIDIKGKGEAFITTEGYSNLNEAFFNDKVAQLENRPYLQNLESWKESSTTMEGIISQGIMHNLNLENPISSPKLQLDYSKLNTTPTEFRQDKNVEGMKASTKKAVEAKEIVAKEEIKKDCPK